MSDDLPKGPFDIILADPPWRFKTFSDKGRYRTPDGDLNHHYDTMDLDDIRGLPVSRISHSGTILFLWATAPMMPQALEVMQEWGFRYRSQMVWVKNKIGTGYWVRNRHELLLIGGRSKAKAPAPAYRPDSVMEGQQRSHSQKPDAVYDLIEEAYPDTTRLEMFARIGRRGWTLWGNQVDEYDVLN